MISFCDYIINSVVSPGVATSVPGFVFFIGSFFYYNSTWRSHMLSGFHLGILFL
ncbi:MAG: hypothetical protein Q8903_10360 [Bacteroidota bacterium]|nr:hypothetical protein [Bacteroidota bacterium]